jgi:hypothetical protein
VDAKILIKQMNKINTINYSEGMITNLSVALLRNLALAQKLEQ